jgi:SAM-dependent methyltransferase
MWTKLVSLLRYQMCKARLVVSFFGEAACAMDGVDVNTWGESDLLVCSNCSTWFPATHGVPILLLYSTPDRDEFAHKHSGHIDALTAGHSVAKGEAVRDELVMRSFSTEWLDHDFDGVVSEMDYVDHERRFLAELGYFAPEKERPGRILEIGCGLGITTAMAHKNFGSQAVGVDLSLAAWWAATNCNNPSLYFVQASVFALPFEAETCDTVYTRGVPRHPYSTNDAVRAMASLCRPGRAFYAWIYGLKSINDNLLRRVVYGVDVVMRVILNRRPHWLSTLVFLSFALWSVLLNRLSYLSNPRIQVYNYRRALHASRERIYAKIRIPSGSRRSAWLVPRSGLSLFGGCGPAHCAECRS